MISSPHSSLPSNGRIWGQWSGGTGTYTLPRSAIDGSVEGCAVLVQTGGNGHILGAAKMELMPSN